MALKDNIVAAWRMEGNSNDSVGSNTGTDTNITYSTANGINGQGAGFNGTTSKILVNDSINWTMGSGDFTVSLWAKRAASGARHALTAQCNSSGSNTTISWLLEIQSANTIRGLVCSGSTAYIATSTGTITDANWHHYMLIRSGNTLYIYIDNVQAGTADVTGVTINDSTNKLGIGALGEVTSLFWSGAIDEVNIWKGKAANSSERAQLYYGAVYPFASGFFF